MVDATARSGLIIFGERPLQGDGGVASAIARFRSAGVVVVVITGSSGASGATAADGPRTAALTAAGGRVDLIIERPGDGEAPGSAIPIGARLIAGAARSLGLDLTTSWVIGSHGDEARSAALAGCGGVVLIGPAAPGDPDEAELGIPVSRTDSLTDAPRVMIPRDGGCWHRH